MVAFLIAFGLISLLVVCCVGVSLYLFSCGVIGRRNRRARRLQKVAVETGVEDDSEDEGYMTEDGVDETSRFARNGILFLFGSLLVIGLLLTMLYNLLPH